MLKRAITVCFNVDPSSAEAIKPLLINGGEVGEGGTSPFVALRYLQNYDLGGPTSCKVVNPRQFYQDFRRRHLMHDCLPN
jgi:hypothetical protein